jgi:hypothetical protein
MKTPRQVLLARHAHVSADLDTLRRRVLESLETRHERSVDASHFIDSDLEHLGSPGLVPARLGVREPVAGDPAPGRRSISCWTSWLRTAWLELVWVPRGAWAALAACWGLIVGLNLAFTRSEIPVNPATPGPSAYAILVAQRRAFAELNDTPAPAPSLDGPRSDATFHLPRPA